MQQANSIHSATINAFANASFGKAAAVSIAAAHAYRTLGHAVSKCPDSGKKVGKPQESWCLSSSEGWRVPRVRGLTPPMTLTTRTMTARTRTMREMPPALWATWVLGQPLCG